MAATFVPLDQIAPLSTSGPTPLGSGLLPSVQRTRTMIDQLRGGAPVPQQARAVEQLGGLALGAALSGAASAQGWGDPAIGILGAAAIGYGITQGQPLLATVGQGILAPVIAEYVRRAMVAPRAGAAQPSNVVSMPRPAQRAE